MVRILYVNVISFLILGDFHFKMKNEVNFGKFLILEI